MIEERYTGSYGAYKVLRFSLGEVDFAIKLSNVNEIINMTEIRKIPRSPAFIDGVIHLRGNIIIIVDLRKLFRIVPGSQKKPKIIIYSMKKKQVGFIVDDVSRIVQKNSEDILPPPPIIIKGPTAGCIFGIFEDLDKNVLLLELEKSFSALEEQSINEVLKQELTYLIDEINE